MSKKSKSVAKIPPPPATNTKSDWLYCDCGRVIAEVYVDSILRETYYRRWGQRVCKYCWGILFYTLCNNCTHYVHCMVRGHWRD